MLHLKNCHIVDEVSDFHDDILIEGKNIKLIGKEKIEIYINSKTQSEKLDRNNSFKEEIAENEFLHEKTTSIDEMKTLDLKNAIVMPSFADLHFHLRNPGQAHKETLLSANKAALRGGYTHFLAMANTDPVIDNLQLLEDITAKNDQLSMCTLFQAASLTRGLLGKKLTDFESLTAKTKFFSDDGRNVDDEKLMEEALFLSKELGFTILDHCEDEAFMVRRNIKLAEKTKGRLHFCHISKKEAMQEIIRAKDKGLSITAEVAPHHIFFDSSSYKVNPPFASKEDRKFLIKSIKEGYVDAVATDHAPHTAKDKINGAPGISGIETALSLCHKIFKKEDISLKILSRLLSGFPGRFLNLSPKRIAEDMMADIVVVSERKTVIDSNNFESQGKNTPFNGYILDAAIAKTIKEGAVLYDNEQNQRESY